MLRKMQPQAGLFAVARSAHSFLRAWAVRPSGRRSYLAPKHRMEYVTTSEPTKPLYTWVGPREVRDLILGKEAAKDYVVIDVRDSDRVGGHIVGSVNAPSTTIVENTDIVVELVRTHKDTETVVFHCALSQQRSVDITYHNFSPCSHSPRSRT
jgi:hypothetical protein